MYRFYLQTRFYSSSAPINTSLNVRLSQIAKAYNPAQFEPKIRERWKEKNLSPKTTEESYRIIFPPPNVTGNLHLGHALTVAIQDTILRTELMRGVNMEWIPGFDHAGIATYSLLTKKLNHQSSSPINDENLNRLLLEHSEEKCKKIREQLHELGAMLNWEKSYFTMDKKHSRVVEEAFIDLFENGIIHRGNGMVNWCFSLKSSLADIEVDEIDFKGRMSFKVPGYNESVDFGLLYHSAYQIPTTGTKIVVATSRPETMFGDVAIAVHPSDPKNKAFIGQYAINPANGKSIPIIQDERVKIDFGTGAVKITPAHDKLDFSIGLDHKLPSIHIYDANGHLNDNCGDFKGLHRFKARYELYKKLKNSGAIVDVTNYSGSVGICSRTQDVIEHLLIPHWFFKTKQLTQTLISCINSGDFQIRPQNLQVDFVKKLEAAHDWCLSRQIKWGHQIPAYYHKDFPDNLNWVTARSKSEAIEKLATFHNLPKINPEDVVQDPDVLDTWFSSALIPLSLSDWPDSSEFKEISLMETGSDILFFWVWRMVMLNLALVNKLPFRNVLLHGVVVDHYGRKMSKSRGNVIDPLDIIHGKNSDEMKKSAEEGFKSGEIEKLEYELRLSALKSEFPNGLPSCGSDALRFALLSQNIYDQNVKINLSYLENCKHFCNKMWQAMRLFIHYAYADGEAPDSIYEIPIAGSSEADKWILSCLHSFVVSYEVNMRECRFHLVAESIRTFFQLQYCDVYLELVKIDLQNRNNFESHLKVMRYVLLSALKLAHPFLPHVTEEMWSVLNPSSQNLIFENSQPTGSELNKFQNSELLERMERGLTVVRGIRAFRAKYFSNSQNTTKSTIFLIELHEKDSDLVQMGDVIQKLGRVKLCFDASGNNGLERVGDVFEMEGGRSCRVSCLKSEINVEDIDKVRISKLREKLIKLKEQYESPEFQRKASFKNKEKLKRKVEILQSKVEEASSISINDPLI